MAILGQKGGDTGLPNIMFSATDTWTPSCNIEAMVYCIGGGGSGALSNENVDYSASGGGAGGTAVSRYTFLSGTAYTITIGAGGASAGATNAATATAGNAGGASSIAVGGSAFVTANGGGAGAIGSSAGCSGGAGGSSSGGNIANYTGGSGGACASTRQASGGGATGLWMNGSNGQAGITGASTSSVVEHSFGGALNQYQEGGVYGTGTEYGSMDTYLYGNVQDVPVLMSPFPEIFSYDERQQQIPRGADDGDPSMWKSETEFYRAGQIMNGGYDSRKDALGSDGNGWYIGQTTGPFEGGKGSVVTDSLEWGYGARVSMGAGSGAVRTTKSDARCTPAKGGAGIVLIFPISMG
ncbi:MAG: hypothetical protein Unbinned2851contig1000_17 [Prokaryotic dsDNA virus sp.]|nr:MAG: hypothetical protein Unbinned2851contig1000_17 [Prokaryotic dsDNA virus sp.]|tara:strand:+ start:21989 stop:23047 length:1059 start_codon:yes stop_codon:yes gene_type:complete